MWSNELFAYRHNSDSTIEAICLTCFLTVATADNDAELQRLASGHKCPMKPKPTQVSV